MYAGGYTDYLYQKKPPETIKAGKKKSSPPPLEKPKPLQKLTYNEARELTLLPSEIETLNREINDLEDQLSDSSFFTRDPKAFARASELLETHKHTLSQKEERWLELLEKEESISALK